MFVHPMLLEDITADPPSDIYRPNNALLCGCWLRQDIHLPFQSTSHWAHIAKLDDLPQLHARLDIMLHPCLGLRRSLQM